jgi:hypothetical protein
VIDEEMYSLELDGPIDPEPSSCPLGNGVAKALNIIATLMGRRGRFFYLNPR